MGNWPTLLQRKQSLAISLSAAMAALLVLAMMALLMFILFRGGGYFWPKSVVKLEYVSATGGRLAQYASQLETRRYADTVENLFVASSAERPEAQRLSLIASQTLSAPLSTQAAVIRLESGAEVLGEPVYLMSPDDKHVDMNLFATLHQKALALNREVEKLRSGEMADIHQRLAEMTRREVDEDAPARVKLNVRFDQLQQEIALVYDNLLQYRLVVAFADGNRRDVALVGIQDLYYPHQLGWFGKLGQAVFNFWHFMVDSPKQNNTSGGVFPALFGTVLMVLLMTILVTPLGVLAAVYLHEYAPQNKFTSLIRVSVNNLAGVPSIVYGVFGLGFFVYTLGGSLDKLLFSDQLPSPTLGTPGLFWASLTMAMLTLPVVIVATEEGLRRVPDSLRKGSFALGATHAETIRKTVIPIASPGIMTGIILAIARGAGEVAPLMLVGAVKFAPALPIDGEFPFLHLQRQFMHLGVLVYDGAFHSQSIGQGSSFMFASCMLLLVFVFILNLAAVMIRNRLRRQYSRV